MAGPLLRLLADANVVAAAVRALRQAGYDVVHLAERSLDPGDEGLLQEAVDQDRVIITKDRDLGALVFRDRRHHCGVVLYDDLGDPSREADMLARAITLHAGRLIERAFLRLDGDGLVRRQE
jgi:uncharacterized protein with PIN domain